MEASARNDAQLRVQRLLQQNTDLLQHISLLVKQIQELELKANGRFASSEFSHLPVGSPPRLRFIHAAVQMLQEAASCTYLMATTAEAAACVSPHAPRNLICAARIFALLSGSCVCMP